MSILFFGSKNARFQPSIFGCLVQLRRGWAFSESYIELSLQRAFFLFSLIMEVDSIMTLAKGVCLCVL